ncbi:MAG: glutathione S-transferase [SAR86 cluster bacterium]|uniref:Glutathione S-transferase n=1 Tax=SAR86 cluster bacterium TaxID=2030880 RepID=A0A2A4MTA4_9GAMM|nr:MAG: glutathione S-transferase [SAR86 cluster bacterium]
MSVSSEQADIDLYTWSTPNGRKISIMLEEIGFSYRVFAIDISKGEQSTQDFLKLSPNGKIPAIVDNRNGMSLMESGAILLYLAQLSGQLLPKNTADNVEEYWQVMQWLMLQMGGVGPMLGQTHHFVKFNPGVSAYAEKRYRKETARLYSVLDTQLARQEFLAGEYSIADIATWPWISRYEFQQMNLHDYPNLLRWYLSIAVRPAVIRGYGVPSKLSIPIPA